MEVFRAPDMEQGKGETQEAGRLWGGRYSAGTVTHCALEQINRSIQVDQRLYEQDIQGSLAYASALHSTGILNEEEKKAIQSGLHQILQEWKDKKFVINSRDEDIHSANERRLSELIGLAVGGKLHTGRSRNDQVSTDSRLWLRAASVRLASTIETIIEEITKKAEQDIDVLVPGYTHLQRAQPVRWSHWLLSHAWFLRADRDRLDAIVNRAMSEMPLGSGALAGTPLPLDRSRLAAELGFSGVSHNSMHAVADRDFLSTLHVSLTLTHLSRFAEDLILYCTAEFGFVKLDEGLTTGSSLMPHKRNPDGLELVRAKAAAVSAQSCKMLTLMKGLPSTYNKDLQEDKAAMFSAYDDINLALDIICATVQGMQVNVDICQAALSCDVLATDLAYYLVKKGVPFREAHRIVGETVKAAENRNCQISHLSMSELQSISGVFDEDARDVWSFEISVEQYKAEGGTSRASVHRQINLLKNCLTYWRQGK